MSDGINSKKFKKRTCSILKYGMYENLKLYYFININQREEYYK